MISLQYAGILFVMSMAAQAPAANHFQILKSFGYESPDGGGWESRVMEGSDGVLYGTTPNGGNYGDGTLFRLNKDGGGYLILHHFGNQRDDRGYPQGGLIEGSDGALYGTTSFMVFKMDRDGGAFTMLHRFDTGPGTLQGFKGVVEGSGGTLYGTAFYGGPNFIGAVFKLNRDGTGYSALHNFGSDDDGRGPVGGLIRASDGAFYGATVSGGSYSFGTLFGLSQDGSLYRILHHFSFNSQDSQNPQAGLLEAIDGSLYGTAVGWSNNIGVVFKVNKNGADYSILHRFDDIEGDGRSPNGALVQDSNGVLYGTTSTGGTNYAGTVFRLDRDGQAYAVLHHFSFGGVEAAWPQPGLIRGSDGALYGTTEYGGDFGMGTIFKLSVPATLTVNNLHDSGAGSLRQAILDAAPGDEINFAVNGIIILTNGQLLITNDVFIIGRSATNLAISGNYGSRVFQIGSNATVTISGLTIRDGRAQTGEHGGGFYNLGRLALTGCALTGNSAGGGSCADIGGRGGNGGAIYNAGTLTVRACAIIGNSAGSGCFAHGGQGGDGGAIFNDGTLAILVSTISGNLAGNGAEGGIGGGSGGNGGNGGGIYNAGVLDFRSCTIARNFSGNGGYGTSGGYFSRSGNGGNGGSGGGMYSTAAPSSAHLANTLVAFNSLGDFGRGGNGPAGIGLDGRFGSGPDLAGEFTSDGHNLITVVGENSGFTNGIKSDQVGNGFSLDPKLGPVQYNGGPTMTAALLRNSPAIDQGDDALLDPPLSLTTDQRGLSRKSSVHVDIGAYEVQAPLLSGPGKIGNDIVLTFTTEVGQDYRLERIDVLRSGPWATVTDNIPGSGTTVQTLDTGAASRPQRFYRVVMLPWN